MSGLGLQRYLKMYQDQSSVHPFELVIHSLIQTKARKAYLTIEYSLFEINMFLYKGKVNYSHSALAIFLHILCPETNGNRRQGKPTHISLSIHFGFNIYSASLFVH